ncbi:hypothetical protein JOD29_003174 [Lysinibacillus composti]|nr:hypothetical protein [Lysinibacillus composti]MBM7609898.1 hypothetical protein [Lysinibacillus composti]
MRMPALPSSNNVGQKPKRPLLNLLYKIMSKKVTKKHGFVRVPPRK